MGSSIGILSLHTIRSLCKIRERHDYLISSFGLYKKNNYDELLTVTRRTEKRVPLAHLALWNSNRHSLNWILWGYWIDQTFFSPKALITYSKVLFCQPGFGPISHRGLVDLSEVIWGYSFLFFPQLELLLSFIFNTRVECFNLINHWVVNHFLYSLYYWFIAWLLLLFFICTAL